MVYVIPNMNIACADYVKKSVQKKFAGGGGFLTVTVRRVEGCEEMDGKEGKTRY